jgi:hypothetical protein
MCVEAEGANMNRTPTGDEHLAAVRDDWMRAGLSTEPADRKKTEYAVLAAYESIGHGDGSHLFIWVDSPMAGVIASTFVGFALDEPLRPKLMKQVTDAISVNNAAAQTVRRRVDEQIWHRARAAVHKQVAAELETRHTDAAWQRKRDDIGNYAWDQVWQTVGDPMYGQYFDEDARASGALFEENLNGWADAMMEGQFSAGTMAQLEALGLLTGLDLTPFAGLQRIAHNCCWWWAFDTGAVLCEHPAKVEINGKKVSMDFRDGWRVGY